MYHPIIIMNELKDKSSGVSGQSSHLPVLGEQNFIHKNPLFGSHEPSNIAAHHRMHVHAHAMVV